MIKLNLFSFMILLASCATAQPRQPTNIELCGYVCKQHSIDKYKDQDLECTCRGVVK